MIGRWFHMAINTFTGLGPTMIYLIAGFLMLKRNGSNLSVGDITVMVALSSRIYRPVSQLLDTQINFIQSMALFSRIFNYLDMPIEIKNKINSIKHLHIIGKLTFNDVNFHYQSDTPILKSISFSVDPGKKIALVGPSGSGKSTISSLITRLYDVTGGEILIDGYDI